MVEEREVPQAGQIKAKIYGATFEEVLELLKEKELNRKRPTGDEPKPPT